MKKMTKFDMKSKTKFCVIIIKIINDYFPRSLRFYSKKIRNKVRPIMELNSTALFLLPIRMHNLYALLRQRSSLEQYSVTKLS